MDLHQGDQPAPRLTARADRGYPINVSHEAATPPGIEVRANVESIEVARRKLVFTVEAHDGVDVISRGRHERFVIDKAKFDAKLAVKAGVNHQH